MAAEIKKENQIDIFSEIKNRLDIQEVLEVYGVDINPKGFALCPFHSEKTPSFRINGKNNTFKCFGCDAGGSVIDFVMKYFNLSAIEAAKKTDADFNLNLLNRPPTADSQNYISRKSMTKIKEDKELIENFEVWEKQAFITVSSYYRALRFWGEQLFVNHIRYFDKYLPEIENIVFIEKMLDMMIMNTHNFDEQIKFYENYGEAVSAIEFNI